MRDEPLTNTAQAASRSSQPYRRHIVGLPLQRSLFDLTARAATTIGLPGLTCELDFPARLDEKGDLFLDRAQIAALTAGLLAWFTPERLELMHTRHAAACDALVEASKNVAHLSAAPDCAAATLTKDLADRMALVLTYGVLSKFVPDVLLRALVDAGDVEPPPFPEKSAGAELMQETFGLYQACGRLDYTPERLRKEWPRVSPKVFQLVGEFCERHTGFGPLAWESSGYEDPSYVIRLLHSAFDRIDAEQVSRRCSFPQRGGVARPASKATKKVIALRRLLEFWLDFLERETWYVRRAFFIGMVPLLRQLAVSHRARIPALQPADPLFFEVHELITGIADPLVIRMRRRRYMENSDYLSLHGVNLGRLETLLGS